jgi:hypothetical protein
MFGPAVGAARTMPRGKITEGKMKRLAMGLGLALVAAGMFSGARAALAAEPYKSLLGEGYELKSVVVLNSHFTTVYGGKVDESYTAIVSLQKGASTAACYIYVKDWINQSLGSTNCNVFK